MHIQQCKPGRRKSLLSNTGSHLSHILDARLTNQIENQKPRLHREMYGGKYNKNEWEWNIEI